jgi:hypothetical protein
MPLKRSQGQNLHPSPPGWKSCEFPYKNHVRKYLLLASLGNDIGFKLPRNFPTTGRKDAMEWAFKSSDAAPPNIVIFVAALLNLL